MSSKVYFTPVSPDESAQSISKKVVQTYKAAGLHLKIKKRDLVALKIHFGEQGNRSFIKPEWLKGLVETVKEQGASGFWTDTNTLYTGPRANAVSHIVLAAEHGYSLENTGIPVIIADGVVGREEFKVKIDGKHSKEVGIATGVAECDNLIVITHPTGHLVSGVGATIKNVGMGLSSRKGKLYQHSVVKPWIKERLCVGCGMCIKWCPVSAISMTPTNKAKIDASICYGCGECLAACRVGAVSFAWQMASEGLQERMAEQAWGVIKHMEDRIGYVSILINFAKDCDCLPSSEGDIIMPALGILASNDPVALDKATIDLLEKALEHPVRQVAYDINWQVQLTYAEELGAGNQDYELITL